MDYVVVVGLLLAKYFDVASFFDRSYVDLMMMMMAEHSKAYNETILLVCRVAKKINYF
jgi:hypothetical protein